jgi:hypothetical protein
MNTFSFIAMEVLTMTGTEIAEFIGIPKAFFSTSFLFGVWGVFFVQGWHQIDMYVQKMAEIEEGERRER